LFQATTKPLSAEYDDEVIMTSVGFADRQASLQAAVEFDTDKAIADLYAHVAQMPDSACKRRLMKQVGRTYSDSHFTPPLLQSIFSLQKSHSSSAKTFAVSAANRDKRGNYSGLLDIYVQV